MTKIENLKMQSLTSEENPAKKNTSEGALAGRNVCQSLKSLSPVAKIMALAGCGLVVAGSSYAARNALQAEVARDFTCLVDGFYHNQTTNQCCLLNTDCLPVVVQEVQNATTKPSNFSSSQTQIISLQNRQELGQKKSIDGVATLVQGLVFTHICVFCAVTLNILFKG